MCQNSKKWVKHLFELILLCRMWKRQQINRNRIGQINIVIILYGAFMPCILWWTTCSCENSWNITFRVRKQNAKDLNLNISNYFALICLSSCLVSMSCSDVWLCFVSVKNNPHINSRNVLCSSEPTTTITWGFSM